jgi:anti-sigma regulatory factor (Ser/Thr protein kinase)
MRASQLPLQPVVLTIYNNLSFLPIACETITRVCKAHGFDEMALQQIEMASEEAIANVIQHAFSSNDKEQFQIEIEPISTGVCITIRDKGMPYNPNDIEFDQEALTGLGSFIIGKLMDKVVFNNLGQQGKSLALYKYFPTQELVQEPTVSETTLSTPETAQIYTYTYRLFEPQDAIEIAKCAYESYGYTYAYEHIYFPERVVALNQSGDLISLVAIADTGEIAGHVGLVKFDGAEGLYEVGLAMTKQKFRGGNIFSNLMTMANSIAVERQWNALFGQCVTTHTYSQRQPIKQGMLPTALLPAYIPDNIDFKKIADSDANRTAILLVTQLLKERKAIEVFVPIAYKPLVAEIYQQYPQSVSIISTPGNLADLPQHTLSTLSFNPKMQMAKLFINTLGQDFESHMKKQIQHLKKEKIQMMEIFFNVQHLDAILTIQQAEQLGCKFVGLLPGAAHGDFGVLQYLNGIDAHTNKIQVVDQGQYLLSFIQSQFD